ncbi:L-glutamate gamma-semialdehyde dehydrogenase [Candidatus Sumerlaeota bacterium]|nr:L-glutamate gamma-semialdehyde dehydrogenase [Candidatus Sumerlaeota bacterium]
MLNGIFRFREPINEPVLSYAPESKEKAELKSRLKEMLSNPVEIPCIIGGKEIRTGDTVEMRPPHNLSQKLGIYHRAGEKEAQMAIEAAGNAWLEWSEMDWISRAAVLLRAGELLSGKYRQVLNAATMLCMSKNVFQAEIDSACELIDFWRFNPYYMRRIYEDQPQCARDVMNYMEYRALEGFVFAITPFNFTSIAGNLPTSPALMGNTVVWKPASSAVLPAYYIMKILKEAGLPDGVINMIPGAGSVVGPSILKNPGLGGAHFTGSTAVFANIWKTIGGDVLRYKSYPRIVGETGGKNFVIAHASADSDALVAALIRGAFEYQGQKCSAVSRAYIPESLWKNVRENLQEETATIRVGDVCDFSNFMNAIIDKKAYQSISKYIDYAKDNPEMEIVCGGRYDDKEGYFIQPTIVVSKTPDSKLMREEIFGPVLCVYVYADKDFDKTLETCDATSPYGLTGAIFARDRGAIQIAMKGLRHCAGNFYINDKPTGAVVGQQPFGGARASGTNDKAGSALNLIRWASPRAIKENLVPPANYRYPFLKEK